MPTEVPSIVLLQPVLVTRLWKQEGAAAQHTTVLSKDHGLFKHRATTEIGKKLRKKSVVGHLCKFNTQQSVIQVV